MKIKFNNLPDGFEVRNGEIIESKKSGGSTGDQRNYGLVTTPKDGYIDDDLKVNYSMTSVPRDEANIEAEGGETVLADLNGDGSFNLYDIKGPRHNSGGVPLNLPEQSFVYSDFNKMKFTKDEMAEMGIESKKRLTPAKISKKYGTNEYDALLKDPYSDDIQAKTAELMLDKNKRKLSKLSFMQEKKKDFEDGVPVTSFPFLVEQGQDPIEFTQKVEQISRQKAEQKLIQSLPPEQQMQIAAMQQYMAQVDQQQQAEGQGMQQGMQQMPQEMQGMQQQMPMQQQGMLPPPGMDNQQLAQMGYEVSTNNMDYAQAGEETTFDILKNSASRVQMYAKLKKAGILPQIIDNAPYLLDNPNVLKVLNEALQNVSFIEKSNLESYKKQLEDAVVTESGMAQDNPIVFEDPDPVPTQPVQQQTKPKKPRAGRTRGDKTNVAYDDDTFGDIYTELGITFDPVNINARKYRDVQSQKDMHFGDATENVLGFDSSWADVYPGYNKLQEELKRTKGKGSLPQVKEFQIWFNDIYIPQFAEDWVVNHIKEEYGGNVTSAQRMSLKKGVIQSMKEDFGFDTRTGRKLDGKFGTFTSSRRPFGIATKPQEIFPTAEEYKPGQTVDPAVKKESELEPGDLKVPYSKKDPRFWLQDLLKINAVANRKRKKFYPWQQPVENVEVNWLLEDPTRAIAATNEQLGIMTDAIGAFTGPQSLNARTANAQGKAATNIANVIAGVHNRNINTTNKGLALQTQYDSYINAERRKRSKQLYDDTMKVEQNYMNEKNYDREQMADLVANAYTNAANTYNLNSLYDYYNIDPSTGGLINFTDSKAWNYTEQGEDDYLNRWIDAKNRLEKAGVKDPKQETINKIMEQYYPNQTKSAMDKARQQYIDNNPFDVDKSSAIGEYRKGKEVNHKLLPFFVGAIGI